MKRWVIWTSRRAGFVAGAVLATTPPSQQAWAQVVVELGPFLGIYVPTGSFESDPFLVPIPLPSTSRHRTAFLAGGRGILWIGSHAGLAAEVATASSAVLSLSGGQELEQSARVSLGTLQLVLPLHTSATGNRSYVGAGPGLVWRGGDFYEAYDPQRNIAAVVGGGGHYSLSPRFNVHLGFQTLLYTSRLRQGSGAESTLQADLLARVGLVLRLGP